MKTLIENKNKLAKLVSLILFVGLIAFNIMVSANNSQATPNKSVGLNNITAQAQGSGEGGSSCPVCSFFGCDGGPDNCLSVTVSCGPVSITLDCYQPASAPQS